MAEITLDKFPDFPSYQSCIKSYGRSILPPLILPSEHEKLAHFRAKAVATEDKLTAQKEDCNKFMTLIQKLTTFMQSKDISVEECFSVLEDDQVEDIASPLFSISNTTACDTKNFRTGIHYEEIVDNDVENFSSSIISNSNKKTSNALSVESNCIEKQCLSNDSWATTDSGVSEEKVQSDTECSASLQTVILRNSSDDEQESIITSIAHSTDLEKYLDSSFDAGQTSEGSVANEERKENYRDLSSATSDSTMTIVDSSHSSTPVVQPIVENDILDKNEFSCPLEDITQPDSNNCCSVFKLNPQPIQNGAFEIEGNNCTLSNKNKDDMVETKNQKSWLKKVLDKAQAMPKAEVKASKSDSDNTNTSFHPHHIRSNSYTLETPSPCLALSHVGCLCETSPEAVISPHCHSLTPNADSTAIQSEKSENCQLLKLQNDKHNSKQMDESNVNDEPSMSCLTVNIVPEQLASDYNDIKEGIMDKLSNESVSFVSQTDTESSSLLEVELNDSERKSAFESQSYIPLQELVDKFNDVREKTFQNLAAEHNKQWLELTDDFNKQEEKLNERLAVVKLNQSKHSELPSENPSESIVTSIIHYRPVKGSQHAVSMPISTIRQYMANNNAPYKDPHIEPKVLDLSDPSLQKKFEKVSAAVKGYLTRCLWNSDVVQAIVESLKDCARQVVHIKQENTRTTPPTEHDLRKRRHLFRKIVQLDAEFDDIFFNSSIQERMKIISDSRESNKHKSNSRQRKCQTVVSLPFSDTLILKDRPSVPINKRKLSSATIKAIERKQMGHAQNIPGLHVSKKPLNVRARTRRRILSPRSCAVSPPSSWKFSRSNSPGKRNLGSNKVKACRSLY